MYAVNESKFMIRIKGSAIYPVTATYLPDGYAFHGIFVQKRAEGTIKEFGSRSAADMYARFLKTTRIASKKELLSRVKDPETRRLVERLCEHNSYDYVKAANWIEAVSLGCSVVNIMDTPEYRLAKAVNGKISFEDLSGASADREQAKDADVAEEQVKEDTPVLNSTAAGEIPVEKEAEPEEKPAAEEPVSVEEAQAEEPAADDEPVSEEEVPVEPAEEQTADEAPKSKKKNRKK